MSQLPREDAPDHRRRGTSGPSIRDVAAASGVSYQTVSRVLNDSPRVLPETRRQVEETIGSSVTATVNYVPGTGRTTNVAGPTQLSSAAHPVTNGTVTVPVLNEDASGAYQLVLTPR